MGSLKANFDAVRELRSRRGFTFVELCIGMVITSLILGALAAFSLATAKTWHQSESTTTSNRTVTASAQLVGTVAGARLESELRDADATGAYFSGSLSSSAGQQASLLLWKTSTNTASIQFGQLELLEYDSTAHTMYIYTASGTGSVQYGTQFSQTSYITTFKQTATKTPLVRNLDGAHFFVQTATSSTQRPLVEYQLRFDRLGQKFITYGAVCLRAPTTPTGMTLN